MDRHLIARKVMVDEIPKALVDDRFFHKRGAHAHGHSADDLASRGFGIENTAGGTYSEHSPHADFSRCGVYGHLDEMRAEGRLLVAFVQIAILNGVLGPQISLFCHIGQCETEIACAHISVGKFGLPGINSQLLRDGFRAEQQTSELQSLMPIMTYALFLKK